MKLISLFKQTFYWRHFNAGAGFNRAALPADLPSRAALEQAIFLSPSTRAQQLEDFKFSCPLVSFRQGPKGLGYIQGIIADFDVLPDGFASFDTLSEDLRGRFPDAYVFRSARGKTKAVWFVKAYRKHISTLDATQFLAERLPDLLYAVDLTSAALSQTFMDSEALEGFATWAAQFQTVDEVLAELPTPWDDTADNTPRLVTHRYFEAPWEGITQALRDRADDLAFAVQAHARPAFRRLFGILVACRGLATDEGHGLSTLVLAKQLGVTHQTVSRWLRNLCDRGILAWLGNRPLRGLEAKSFVTRNAGLLFAIEEYAKKCGPATGRQAVYGGVDLTVVARKIAAAHGVGHTFRQKLTMVAAAGGHSLEDACDAARAVDAGYFNGKRERMREMKAHFKGAQASRWAAGRGPQRKRA